MRYWFIPAFALKLALGLLSSIAETLSFTKTFCVPHRFRINRHTTCSGRDAFSLAEVAIVMGVAGIILAGLWSYVSTGMENARIEKAKEEIFAIVQNIRGYYGGQAGMPTLTTDLITAQLAAAGIFPDDILRSNNNCHQMPGLPRLCPDDPWGPMDPSGAPPSTIGSFMVCPYPSWYVGYCPDQLTDMNGNVIMSTQFGIALLYAPASSCAQLAAYESSPMGPPGLVDVFIGGTSMRSLGHGFPISIADALPNCSPNRYMIFVYRLWAPP
jgi:hypothetical protein